MKRRATTILLLAAVWIAVFGSVCGCGRARGEQTMVRKTFRGEIRSLDLEVGAAQVRFLKNQEFAVETDNPHITVRLEGDVLTIREEPHIDDLESSVVLIYLSADVFFDQVEMELGAGSLEGLFLNCDELALKLGAGEMRFDSIQVIGEAEISGGAGAMDLNILQARELDLELGVGECVIHHLTVETADLEAGVGNLDLTLSGSPEDYTIHIERGLGEIVVDGEDTSGGICGSGPRRVELSGGIGNVEIRFETE